METNGFKTELHAVIEGDNERATTDHRSYTALTFLKSYTPQPHLPLFGHQRTNMRSNKQSGNA